MANNGVVEPYAASPGTVESEPSDGLDLLEILLILSASRWKIFATTIGAMILGAALAVFLKPVFTATALILPPQQGSAASSMLGQLGSLASFASGVAVKNPADVYVGILASRTIADDIISKFSLGTVYDTRTLEDTRKALKSNTRLIATNDGLVHILVDDHTADRASGIANAYVDELYAMNSHLAISEAAQRREFFDRELTGEKVALIAAEDDLRKTAEKTGVIQLNGQAESMIRSIAQLRAQIAAQEVHIQALRTFATDQNPESIQAEQEAGALRTQLAQLEKDPRNTSSGSPEFAAGQVPAVSLEYARKFREFKYHETLFDLLSKQYEAARIDEAKAAPLIQTVDRAIAPDKKSGPPRTILTLGFGVLGFFLACVATLASRYIRELEQVPAQALKLARLRGSFRKVTGTTKPTTE
jgi:tyrosine-protein kinase Etk/Wzc